MRILVEKVRQIYLGLKKILISLKGDIVDIGCGSKPYENLCINANKYIGLDLATSSHNHKNSKVDIFFDGINLPFENNCFDNAVAFEVLEHVEELDLLMAETSRILKSKGLFVATIPFIWPEHEQPYDFRRLTSYGLIKLFEKHKFKVLDVQKLGSFWSNLFQQIITYIDSFIMNKGKIRKFLWPFFSIPLNFCSLIIDSLLPKNKDFYNNLIIIGRKI